MKRQEILSRQGFSVSAWKKKRVLIISDVKCEADDQYAIVQHLLSQTEEIKGIIACHSERKYLEHVALSSMIGTSAQTNYDEACKLLELMEMDDVPVIRGCTFPHDWKDFTVQTEAADYIIKEALRDDPMPLYVCCIGAMTDLAIALRIRPEIADRMTVVAISGAAYPQGGREPNIEEDIIAAQQVYASPVPMWQIPMNVYGRTLISLAEIADRIRPCGEIGAYLFEEMKEINDWYGRVPVRMDWPHGETWSIGDNPSCAVLLMPQSAGGWHEMKAPVIRDDMTYGEPVPEAKMIRVYDWIDARFTVYDLISKISLCYRKP